MKWGGMPGSHHSGFIKGRSANRNKGSGRESVGVIILRVSEERRIRFEGSHYLGFRGAGGEDPCIPREPPVAKAFPGWRRLEPLTISC